MSDALNDLRLPRKAAYNQGAQDMRERAATLVEKGWCASGDEQGGALWNLGDGQAKAFAAAIRTLPLDPAPEQTDERDG